MLRSICLFEMESDEEDEFLLSTIFKKRKNTHLAYLNRASEGIYNKYIKKYCFSNQELFQKYLRISINVFNDVLNKIKCDIQSKPYNRHLNPISPAEKLCLALR